MTWNVVISGRYGKKLCALSYEIGEDDKLQPILGEYPDKIEVTGTIEQARWVASCLSDYEAGCNGFWTVEGDPE